MRYVSCEESKYLPNRCPVCGELLVWDGVDLKCNNKKCKNIDYSNLQQWCETIGETEGLQYTIMKQYLEKYNISTIKDLYTNINYVLEDLRTRKLSITESKILEFFEKLSGKYKILANRALVALNIPRLGDKTAKLLLYEPQLVYDLLQYALSNRDEIIYNDIYDRLYKVVKEATTLSIMESLDKVCNLRYIWGTDNNLSNIIFYEKPEEIKYVAITGSLNTMKRKDFEKYINAYGYELSSSLKKCEYLITNTPNSGSSKNKQALEYGIKVITESEFLNLINSK